MSDALTGRPAPPEWSSTLDDGRVRCELCPRLCTMKEGQRGFCFVRGVRDGQVVLTTYGRASGFCIDPIEKKPLNHFYPGTGVLSFGTAGCNLGCRFCQNHDMSKARRMDALMDVASPGEIAAAAEEAHLLSVAFTYNDPVIFAEYAIDTAAACRERGVKTVAVTAGYISARPREAFFSAMDATNIDLKAFTEDFYRRLTFSELAPVLETLEYVRHETDVWLEITTLIIPGHNSSDAEVGRLCAWIVQHLGPDVPLHLSAFHPDFRMTDVPRTEASALSSARQIALRSGLQHVYTGNVRDRAGQSTYCAGCGALLIGRDGYRIGSWALDADGHCKFCGHTLVGRFDATPGDWTAQRRRLQIHR
ncbi:MAG TPA: AmmeMemoRadiSam system radical SAM enzyme [Polyangiaceae bacterium]|nr:AmmeMemoRadiSam system radical SAM enzyme [Polyangiaceae bacterium]